MTDRSGPLELELVLDSLTGDDRVADWSAGVENHGGSVSAELVTLLLSCLGGDCPVALPSSDGMVRLAIPLPATVRV